MPTRPLLYLAAPYSGTEDEQFERFETVCLVAGFLTARIPDMITYSPISHCHPIATVVDVGTDFEAWSSHCLGLLERSDLILVLTLPGWTESKGIRAELRLASELGLPAIFSSFEDIGKINFPLLLATLKNQKHLIAGKLLDCDLVEIDPPKIE